MTNKGFRHPEAGTITAMVISRTKVEAGRTGAVSL
jgi:hypothetical protein